MNPSQINCDELDFAALLSAESKPEDPLWIEHLENCSCCRAKLDAVAASADLLKRIEALSGTNTPKSTDGCSTLPPDEIVRLCLGREHWQASMAAKLLSPPSHPEMLGRIGRYEVERCIGSGGMGVVFKAFDTELNRPVAIKVLRPSLSDNPAARIRFSREAKAAAAVVHEHVVPIYDVDATSNKPFLVMMLVAGESLQNRIDREGMLSIQEILRIGTQIASGLHAAHQQGLVHRDIKPSNILLERTVERALITDFGLARASDDATLTQTGLHLGTPLFMSPEQASCGRVDHRSDLFSFGSLLYAMCTGKSPFVADTSLGVMRRIADDVPTPVYQINPTLPLWIGAIIGKLLAKSPDQRFQTSYEVAQVLKACLAHVQEPELNELPCEVTALQRVEPPKQTRYRSLIAIALVSLLTLAGFMIYLESQIGTITIVSQGENIPIRIKRGDEVIRQLTLTQKETALRVAVGEYVVEVDSPTDDLQVDGGQVTLNSFGKQIVTISLTPREPQPPIAVVMIVHPDAIANGNQLQRDACGRVLQQLHNNDYCGIIHFNSDLRVAWLWPDDGGLAQIAGHRAEFQKLIERSVADDLPDLNPPVEMAIQQLSKVDAVRKHVIIFTDGTPVPPREEIVQGLAQSGISVSVVYPDHFEFGPTDSYKKVVSQTGGKLHYWSRSQTPAVAQAFADEVVALRLNSSSVLGRIASAFESYYVDHGHFPGSKNRLKNTPGDRVQPYSWRVAILPYLGEKHLYDSYRFDEPWDSAHNASLISRMPNLYRTFPAPVDQPNYNTNLLGFAIKEGALGIGFGQSKTSFADGLDKTILVVQSSYSVPWTKPEDLTDCENVRAIKGQPLRYVVASGTVGELPNNFDPTVLRRLATLNAGD